MKFFKYLSIGLICFWSCSSDDDGHVMKNEMIDARDGQVYQTVKIGTQTWFAQNLNYDPIDNTSKCYENDLANCFVYGRLYEGNTVQTICPEGWHLPTVEEWEVLIDYLGGIDVAHVFLAPYGTQQGNEINFNLLAGGRYFANFQDVTTRGYYYTATDGGLPNSFKYLTFYPGESVGLNAAASSGIMNSCRCVKD
ncbi:hypothetical protein A9Q86_06205 [Flavobacteriales bacterium 33_180_T64]|nr:hypothetical protein A9Q86_06205 [Flavobacteriales bacterium 33_180_T64]